MRSPDFELSCKQQKMAQWWTTAKAMKEQRSTLKPWQDAIKTGRLRITANTAAEVRAAMKLAEEFNLKLTLVDPASLDELVESDKKPEFLNGVILNVGVRPGAIANPSVPNPEDPKRTNPWEYAAKLVKKGLGDVIAIRPSSDTDLDDMLFLGGLFTRGGTSTEDALSMLTSNPAKLMGVDDRVGSLKEGMDADFVVLAAIPLKPVQQFWQPGLAVHRHSIETLPTA